MKQLILFSVVCCFSCSSSSQRCIGQDFQESISDVQDVSQEVIMDVKGEESVDYDENDGEIAKEVMPGGFGSFCTQNSDCLSGYCVESLEGFVCTMFCQEECPEGWLCKATIVGQDVVNICIPGGVSLCKPCKTDSQCPEGICLDQGGQKFCTKSCEETPCPQGYECKEIEIGRERSKTKQCLPKSNACDCNITTHNTSRPCIEKNEYGTCLGLQFCDKDKGWSECSAHKPAPEKCNGLDDDCNGMTDEIYAGLGSVCSVGKGLCFKLGVMTCNKTQDGVECNAEPGKPSDELCDNLDNDCDGEVDEDFQDKGKACVVGLGECLSTGVWDCKDDLSGLICNAPKIEPKPEICDNKDNDCDGLVDEDFIGKGKVCIVGKGECLAYGILVCDQGGKELVCSAKPPLPKKEICDDKDNDCDGEIDEDWPDKYKICTEGLGECMGKGIYKCNPDGSGIICSAQTGIPTQEICDDKDNDCDGLVDEEWPEKGKVCFSGKGECQRAGQWVCSDTKDALKCNAVPAEPTPEICDGLDNDCDGEVDEDWPEKGSVCIVGVGACARTGVYICKKDHSGVECSGQPGQAQKESCNYQDDDCDGVTDEDFIEDGKYKSDIACGNCFTNCTKIWTKELHNAQGICDKKSLTPACTYTCLQGYVDADGNPNNGCELFLDPNAIFVATPANGGSDNQTCGEWVAPCATINKGILQAKIHGKTKVFVSEGIYAEEVTLVNGISVLGGFSAVTWSRDPDTNLTILQGVSKDGNAKHKKTVIALDITKPTEVSGFTIYGENNYYYKENDSGGNSYAIYIRDSSSALLVKDNIIYAGRGSQGSPGKNGLSGANGGHGGAGAKAFEVFSSYCVGKVAQGGAGGISPCGANGGAGGSAICPVNNNQQPSGANGTGESPGLGGTGGNDRYMLVIACGQALASGSAEGGLGGNGANGVNGWGGNGCTNNNGVISGNEWVAQSGSSGGSGTDGSGGGGGGAGGGLDVQPVLYETCGNGDTLGSGGGGGGGGGCKGEGGGGGFGGGGSFGIFIIRTQNGPSTLPVISNNFVVRNSGGAGGSGGNGGNGGVGGMGGVQGSISNLVYTFAIGSGGHGGNGGNGGHGGGGGGGCGGISAGIYGYNISSFGPKYCAENVFSSVGSGGPGGIGGNSSGSFGKNGLPGLSSDCLIF